MHLNEHTALVNNKVLLVPYEARHVPAYHEWMGDEDLLQATASERLTLEQEYDMQKSWRQDSDKLTFIICEEDASIAVAGLNPIRAGEFDTPATMVGDINMFLSPYDNGEEASKTEVVGEVELMIAVQRRRRNGLGKSALLLFIAYVLANADKVAGEGKKLVELRAKIHGKNEASVALFEGIGFKKVGEKVNYFGEWDLSIPLTEDNVAALKAQTAEWKSIGYVEH
ncbi:hypothetical protein BJ508DRAFT_302867 [Ascobolus immersus RN42]|uniref:N-acetyltransferase domain-containing protein n=1 Tax=Ascobolus immersus RN42 TaxID=1160509 RepID=A0A3N4IVG9_ASCIM|nr:hypothetical protein BJ508DRAFT_302867 [Ascobolus immersus RN42]